ncbi:MAG: hypothetical protein ACRDYY_05020 [Acidimicrobiales bacterium]
MCERLSQVRQALAGYARSFDAAHLDAAEARAVVTDAAAIEAMAATVMSLAAAHAAKAHRAESGHRSAAEALAAQTGTSVGEARRALETGEHLVGQPALSEAARSGELSAAQVELVSQGARADPGAEARLVEAAKRSSLAELRDEVARIKADSRPGPEEHHRAIRARRRLWHWTDLEGAWHLRATGNPEDGAQIIAALRPIADAIFRRARRAGRREPAEAYAFDALVELATDATSDEGHASSSRQDDLGSTGGDTPVPAGDGPRGDTLDPADPDPADPDPAGPAGHPGEPPPPTTPPEPQPPLPSPTPPPPPAPRGPDRRPPGRPTRRRRRGAPVKLLVRIDYDTWLRGVTAPGETCELVGYGPVAVSVVRDLLAQGDPFVAAILAKGRQLVGVAHLGRQPTAHQQSALEWLYPTCAAQGCSAQAHLQRDHQVDWAKTHYTMFDLLDVLCSHHHALKTRHNWALAPGRGKRPFVPPSDPRHPAHRPVHHPAQTGDPDHDRLSGASTDHPPAPPTSRPAAHDPPNAA